MSSETHLTTKTSAGAGPEGTKIQAAPSATSSSTPTRARGTKATAKTTKTAAEKKRARAVQLKNIPWKKMALDLLEVRSLGDLEAEAKAIGERLRHVDLTGVTKNLRGRLSRLNKDSQKLQQQIARIQKTLSTDAKKLGTKLTGAQKEVEVLLKDLKKTLDKNPTVKRVKSKVKTKAKKVLKKRKTSKKA